MTRHLCALLSVLTLVVINPDAAAPIDPLRHPDLSGTYTLLPDRSVAIRQPIGSIAPPDSTFGRAIVGACGGQFIITQTATQLSIRVVAGPASAPPVDGTYELDHSTTVQSNNQPGHPGEISLKRVAILSWRRAALELTITDYRSETPIGRSEYVFRRDGDGTLTVEYQTNSSAREFLINSAYLKIASVYQKSVP